MAVTVLGHINEGTHLENAIKYILNPEKTEDGILAGGNCGPDAKSVLEAFKATKEEYGKMGGRLAYHFKISFPPGQADEKTAQAAIEDFCREYLGDGYDYVYAIHNDKPHMHGHIIFNSVGRLDGYKYHYKKGDWEKLVQPITDKACKDNGLPPLEPRPASRQKKGVHYAAWNAAVDQNTIMKADIDYAIRRASDMDGFFSELKKMGYEIGRHGVGEAGEYFSMRIPGKGPGGKERRARRNYRLGEEYTVAAIRERIRTGKYLDSHKETDKKLQSAAGSHIKAGYLKSVASHHSKSQARLYAASNYYRMPNPYAVPAWKVREDMKKIWWLVEMCSYMQEKGIYSAGQIEERLNSLTLQEATLIQERAALYRRRKPAQDNAQHNSGSVPSSTEAMIIKEKTAALKSIRKEKKILEELLETERQPEEKWMEQAWEPETAVPEPEETPMADLLDTKDAASHTDEMPGEPMGQSWEPETDVQDFGTNGKRTPGNTNDPKIKGRSL